MATIAKLNRVQRCIILLRMDFGGTKLAQTNRAVVTKVCRNITASQCETKESDSGVPWSFPFGPLIKASRLKNTCNQRLYIRLCHSLTTRTKCWKCDTNTDPNDSFCAKCNSIQKLDNTWNHFEVMGLSVQSTIDTSSLKKKFRLLQSLFHPDRFTTKSEEEQKIAAERSSSVNKAYRVLQHPVQRVEYCLFLHGQPLEEGQIDMEPAFLMEIMEVNEELEDAEDSETVREIGIRNQELLNGLLKEADTAFVSGDISTARKVVAKIKYYNNIYEKVREFERAHGILD